MVPKVSGNKKFGGGKNQKGGVGYVGYFNETIT